MSRRARRVVLVLGCDLLIGLVILYRWLEVTYGY